jgi:hypothetical protein
MTGNSPEPQGGNTSGDTQTAQTQNRDEDLRAQVAALTQQAATLEAALAVVTAANQTQTADTATRLDNIEKVGPDHDKKSRSKYPRPEFNPPEKASMAVMTTYIETFIRNFTNYHKTCSDLAPSELLLSLSKVDILTFVQTLDTIKIQTGAEVPIDQVCEKIRAFYILGFQPDKRLKERLLANQIKKPKDLPVAQWVPQILVTLNKCNITDTDMRCMMFLNTLSHEFRVAIEDDPDAPGQGWKDFDALVQYAMAEDNKLQKLQRLTKPRVYRMQTQTPTKTQQTPSKRPGQYDGGRYTKAKSGPQSPFGDGRGRADGASTSAAGGFRPSAAVARTPFKATDLKNAPAMTASELAKAKEKVDAMVTEFLRKSPGSDVHTTLHGKARDKYGQQLTMYEWFQHKASGKCTCCGRRTIPGHMWDVCPERP